MPQRQHIEWGANTLLTMPAVAEEYCAVKLVSVVPGNAARALPVTNGTLILNDATTGLPLVLMNAAALTAQRTGAVGAVGVKYRTPAATSSVGIVGCGVQAAWQAIFACAVRPIVEVFCVARSKRSWPQFLQTLQQHAPQARVSACRDVLELLQRTDLVIAATSSTEPVLPDEPYLLENKHFISIGSYKPTMQELPDSVYRLAGIVAVDSPHARAEVGDVINPIQRGILRDGDIVPIAEWVTGRRSADPFRTSVYKSIGAAFFDLYVARALHHQARSIGCGREVVL